MPGLLSLTIFTRSTSHALRALPLAAYPLGFLLLFLHGVIADRVNPAIGIVPLTFSAAYSILLLSNEKRCGCQHSGLAGTPLHLFFDVILGIGTLICLILAWVNLGDEWRANAREVMLGTYGTMFLILDFAIHVYFVLTQLHESTVGASGPMRCPQCQDSSFSVGKYRIVRGMKDGYAPLLDEGVPRISVDEPREEDGAENV